MRLLAPVLLLIATPAAGCELALVLGVDVSNSIDASEYEFQRHGMAEAVADPVIAEALIDLQAAVAVVQWSGSGEQEISLPWMRVRNLSELDALALRIGLLERPYQKSDTAVGEALAAMATQLELVPDCQRRVIDFAGDGVNNAGMPPADIRAAAVAAGIVINGLGIDRVGQSVTEYYRGHVIGGRGAFVMTAKGYRDFPRALRAKLFRELLKPVS